MEDWEIKRNYENKPKMTVQQGFVLCNLSKDEEIISLLGSSEKLDTTKTVRSAYLFYSKDDAHNKADEILQEDINANLGIVEVVFVVGVPQPI